MASFGERLRTARKKAELTQEQLGKKCGVSKGAVSQWENGTVADMRADTAIKAARALRISLDWLIDGKGSPEPDAPLSDAEHDLLDVFRALPQSGQDRAVDMLKIASAMSEPRSGKEPA